MKLIVTIPALNEEKTIADVIRTIPRDIPGIETVEVIVCNDGSTDRTAELAEAAGALVINIIGRPGLGTVFRTGLERAMRRGADVMVNIDGDGQFNSADIAQLIRPILQDQADFVTCSRFKDPALRPTMPPVKYYGNQIVTKIINWVCGGTDFADVSCGFRAFNREAAYRMTLFGKFTYTQECFIDLFSKGVRIVEVPLKVRGVREHGKSRIASSIVKYATNSLPIILRAMRDIQPLKFFGGIAGIFIQSWHCRCAVRLDLVADAYRSGEEHQGPDHWVRAQDVAVHVADHGGRDAVRSFVFDGCACVTGRHDGPAPQDQ